MVIEREVPSHISGFELAMHMQLHGVATLGRWILTLNREDDLIWVSHQLGVELGYYTNDIEGCGRALDFLANIAMRGSQRLDTCAMGTWSKVKRRAA